MENKIVECLTCKSLKKEISLSPGEIIYESSYWQIEHAYPTEVQGWLVCVLKRHAEALHEVNTKEFVELCKLQAVCVQALHKELRCKKEYTAYFGEGKGFNHVHIHIIARPEGLSDETKGPKVFSLLGKNAKHPISPEEIARVSTKLKQSIMTEIDRRERIE